MAELLTYDKPYTPPEKIISKLKYQGMFIEDEEKAINFLKQINYYRFKVYCHPLKDITSNQFKPNSSFEKAVRFYRFDEELRHLLFPIIGRLEIKIRTRLDQTITEHTNDPFWYLTSTNFSPNKKMNHIARINDKFMDSKDDFVSYYKQHYINPKNISYPQMPPFWMTAEFTTFGDIVTLYKSLDKNKFTDTQIGLNKLDILAQEFGAVTLDIFNSWLESLKETRNRCAHHSRLWNRNCIEPKGIQARNSRLKISPKHPNKFYSALFVIHHISKKIGIKEADDTTLNVKNKFTNLLDRYPEVKEYLKSIGFPSNWQNMNAWKR